MKQTIVTVKLFDQEYKIKCDEKEVDILESAAELLVAKVKHVQDTHKLSIANATLLTALNLCGEQLNQRQEAINSFSNEQKHTLNLLNQKIATALAD